MPCKTTTVRKPRAKKAPAFIKPEVNFEPFLVDEVVPCFLSHIDFIKSSMRSFQENQELSKEDWTALRNIVDEITTIYDNHGPKSALLAYDREYFIAKYHSNHSNYYKCFAALEAKYLLHQLELADKYKDKQDAWVTNMLTAAYHLFFFIVMPEKLTLINKD